MTNMSYNYDVNPWDDDYSGPGAGQNNTASGAGQQSTGGYATTGYSDGYANQSVGSQGFAADPYQQQQHQGAYQQPQGPYEGEADQTGIQEGAGHQEKQQAPSALGRFLRQHVPLYGPIADTMSSINLPFLDALVQHVNKDLLVSKIFYFFFYSAFGSLFPLMGVYFKQLGMNPAQVGILTGVRPFIEIFSAPFWNSLAERFQKSKALLLFSLLSWILFTYSLAHIRPPASACVAFNDTDYVLYTPYSSNDLSNYDVGQLEEASGSSTNKLEGGLMQENEMFMSKMPAESGQKREKEGKDQILASEENQNDQRRKRRRRRRQVQVEDYARGKPLVMNSDYEDSDSGSYSLKSDTPFSTATDPSKERYLYSVHGSSSNDGGLEQPELYVDVDLENDFDDNLIVHHKRSERVDENIQHDNDHHRVDGSSSFEHDSGSELGSHEYDELEQLNLKGASRYKRGTNGIKHTHNSIVAGGRDESELEEIEERPAKEKQASEDEGYGEEEEESGGESSGGVGNSKNKERSGLAKYNQLPTQPVTGTTSNTLLTTTEMSGEPSNAREGSSVVNKTKRVYKQRHKTPPTHIVGMSPITVEYAVNYNKEKHGQFVTPMFSTIVYKLEDIKEVFFLLLLLISLGEFFSAPALTLADSATLGYLGDNTDLYGRQRMFGSLSWAITLLLVGMALDNATSIADHPCGPHQRERSYTVCFIIFSLLMACAFLTATQFRFNYPKGSSSGSQAMVVASTTTNSNTIVTTTVDGTVAATGNIDELYASTQPRSIFNTAPPVNAPPPNIDGSGGKEKFEFLDKWKSAVFAQRTWELPQWVNVFRQFKNSLHLTYLFITWFLGCGVGLVFTFLFWHLQDVGGTPTLFGICSVINHISEILAYFFSFSFIKRFGHTRVLSVGLGCNVVRFLYVAFLTNPYYALPFELVQGITHAACFAACCSYISHVSKPELRTSTQGVMQGLHHGIGRACGALIGGYMINAIGSRASFCIYGLLSGCVLAGFLYVRRKASQLEDEEEVKVDDSEALGGYGAPQGVPSTIQGIDYQW